MIYANDNDRDAADWLRCLPLAIDAVDDRSIKEVRGNDLTNYTQCHFFAGIGGWPLALKIAEWPDEIAVWTGSCPCQPFSQAGQRRGVADERHLWPEFRRLIDECRPTTVFGEQVASKAGREWLAIVRADLEALGYAVGGADLCAASVGAPHIRQRLFWVAYANGGKPSNRGIQRGGEFRFQPEGCGLSGMANSGQQPPRPPISRQSYAEDQFAQKRWSETISKPGRRGGRCGLGDSDSERQSEIREVSEGSRTNSKRSYWSDVEFITCLDGKARPVKPGVRLLAHGIPGRVAQLCGLGNAIVPQVAATFVRCFMDFLEGESCES